MHDCPAAQAVAGQLVNGTHLPPLHSLPFKHSALLWQPPSSVGLSFLVEQPKARASIARAGTAALST
jgi:hypothetical protein